MSLILVLGAKGLVGQETVHELLVAGHNVIASDIDEIDITDENVLSSAFESVPFEAVINLASVSDPDECQKDYDRAYAVNAIGAKSVARACKNKNVPLIHLSSGYVYESKEDDRISESDRTRADSAYAKSKLFGERFVLESGARAIVIRTTWLFSARGDNFILNVLNKAKSLQSIDVYADEYSCPTPAKALARDMVRILPLMIEDRVSKYGIYNYSSNECISRADLARMVIDLGLRLSLLENEVNVNKIAAESFREERLRPKCIYLNTSKFEKAFSVLMPKCADFIEETLRVKYDD